MIINIKRMRFTGLLGFMLIAVQPLSQVHASTRIETFLKAGIIAPALAGFLVERARCPRCNYQAPILTREYGWARSMLEIGRNAGGATLVAMVLGGLSISSLELEDLLKMPAAMIMAYITGSFFGTRTRR
jgi:hypothetical protein